MTRLPYGFDPAPETLDDDAWSKLYTINEYLSDGEPIPPHLAQWLGLAIQHSERDAAELLRRLGLKQKPGRPNHKYSDRIAMDWGERVFRRESDGERPEAALTFVLAEFEREHSEGVSRAQLQKWRDDYRSGLKEAQSCR